MRTPALLVVLLFTTAGLVAGVVQRVEVVAHVPVIAQVDSPAELELAPGEVRLVTIRVACNQPWLLAVQTDNPQISSPSRHAGTAGGMSAAGHTFTISLACSPAARGPQRTALVTRLISGPLAVGRPH